MQYCEKCGVEYPQGKKFCRKCGSALVDKPESAVKASLPLRCPSCGSPVPAGKKFCRHCGTALENVVLSQPSTENVIERLCSNCGTPVGVSKQFCGKCGLNLSSMPFPGINTVPDLTASEASTAKVPSTPVLSQAAAVVPIKPEMHVDETAQIGAPTPVPIIAGSVVPAEFLGVDARAVEDARTWESVTGNESNVVPISRSRSMEGITASEEAPGVATERKHASPLVIIGACVVAVALGGVLLWYFGLSAEARISGAVNRGDLVTPVGKSAYDLYQSSKSDLGASARERIRAKAVGKVLHAANNMVQRRTQGESMLQSEVDQLVRLYSWAADLAPEDQRALAGQNYAEGLASNILGKPKAALPLLLRSTDYDPNWAPAFNELGKTYVKLNDHSHAAEAYRKAIAIDPTWVFPQLNIGGVYLHDKQWDLAEQSYLRAIQLDTTLATPWYFLAQVYEAEKRSGDAVNAYERALQLAATRPSSAFRPDRVRQQIDKLKMRARPT